MTVFYAATTVVGPPEYTGSVGITSLDLAKPKIQAVSLCIYDHLGTLLKLEKQTTL